MRKLTIFAAENARNTSDKYSPSILLRYRHGQRQQCGAAWYTTSSIRGLRSPSSTAKGLVIFTTAVAEMKNRTKAQLHETLGYKALKKKEDHQQAVNLGEAQVEVHSMSPQPTARTPFRNT
jgi:hypothetical protein